MRIQFFNPIKHGQAGDTIVEVLIAIAIVGSVLAAAFVTTNQNTLSTQDTQERSQALKIAQGQIEYLRKAGTINGSKACFQVSDSGPGTGPGAPLPATNCNYAPNGAGTQPVYSIRISSVVGTVNSTYTVGITWPSLLNDGSSKLAISYRTGQ